MTKPMVSVVMITYGHEQFIEQAINGVLMQDCNFDVELIVANDCSPDNTDEVIQKIIQNHPKSSWIKYIKHEKNLGMMPNFVFALEKSTAKYIAVCEGDDYWTDSFKLQKQVDFLEDNPDYSICWTKYLEKNETDNSISLQKPSWINKTNQNDNLIKDLDSIFKPYCTYTLTCMFKKDALDILLFKKMKYSKDNTLYALCLTKGNGMVLNFYSAVYRIHTGGIYSGASNFNQGYSDYLNLKEIVKISGCDTANIIRTRNQFLMHSIKHYPSHISYGYLKLIIDGFITLGIKKTIRLSILKY